MATEPALPFTLVTAEEVFDSMGQSLDMMEGAKPAVYSAILRATLRLEGLLFTSFKKQLVTDTFTLDEETAGLPLDGYYRLRLSNGCVDRVLPFSVGSSFERGNPWTPFSTYNLDYDKGILYVPEDYQFGPILSRYTRGRNPAYKAFFNVTYTSGFQADDEVPDALKQALLCLVPLFVLSSASATSEPKKQASDFNKANSLSEMAENMVQAYSRRVGAIIKPTFTNRVPIIPVTPEPEPDTP